MSDHETQLLGNNGDVTQAWRRTQPDNSNQQQDGNGGRQQHSQNAYAEDDMDYQSAFPNYAHEDLVPSQTGTPDILGNAAGLWSSTEAIADSKFSKWWGDLKVNIKESSLMIRSFLRLVGSDKEANIVNVGSWGMLNTGAGSSYFISKLAFGKLSEAVPAAYPKVLSINYHPGKTVTDMAHENP
ncbi:putative NAD(P)-binding protein [Seiridium cardinale]